MWTLRWTGLNWKGRANRKGRASSSKPVFFVLGRATFTFTFPRKARATRLRKRATSVYERPVSKRHWRRMYIHFDVTPSERRWWLYYTIYCFGVISCTQYHHASVSVTIPIRNCEYVNIQCTTNVKNWTNEETTTEKCYVSGNAPPIVINERNLSQKLGIGCDELIFLASFRPVRRYPAGIIILWAVLFVLCALLLGRDQQHTIGIRNGSNQDHREGVNNTYAVHQHTFDVRTPHVCLFNTQQGKVPCAWLFFLSFSFQPFCPDNRILFAHTFTFFTVVVGWWW